MDPQAQVSFIPKKTLMPTRPMGGAVGLFYLAAIFIFVGSLVAAGAAFAYKNYLESSIAAKAHSLQLAQGAYEPGAIKDLSRLDARIGGARALLSRHVAPTVVFDILSEETLEQVQFTDFAFSWGDNGEFTIQMSGVADSFSTVALQSDEFGSSKYLSHVVFSNVSIGDEGGVAFEVTAVVDADQMLYRNNIRPEVPEQQETPAQSASTTQQ